MDCTPLAQVIVHATRDDDFPLRQFLQALANWLPQETSATGNNCRLSMHETHRASILLNPIYIYIYIYMYHSLGGRASTQNLLPRFRSLVLRFSASFAPSPLVFEGRGMG